MKRPPRWLPWLVLAVTLAAARFAHAWPVPAGWDLTFQAQRAEEPAIHEGWKLYREIDKRAWQMRLMLQQVPLDHPDAVVFVQADRYRHGLFVQGERAYLMQDRNMASFDVRPVDADEARRLIGRYAAHDGPTLGEPSREALACSSNVARSVVNLLVDGKARQYWLSGADSAISRPTCWRRSKR